MISNSELTIVMYHYVRPIAESKFPKLKGLELKDFRNQLDYLEKNFNIISTQDVIIASKGERSLPNKACWLTFDDGYKDHYKYVLPELLRRGLTAAFFPPRAAITQPIVLDVNSIHHILASCSEIHDLEKDLNLLCLKNGISNDKLCLYVARFKKEFRYDCPTTIYIKRMLQHVLPEDIRRRITSTLFNKHVGVSEELFSNELYMTLSEVSALVSNGMYVGSHGSMHYWLGRISEKKQRLDILYALEFLEEVGSNTSEWIMSYPFGSYNSDTLKILHELQASLAVTSKIGKAVIGIHNSLELPRLDTNHFPK